MLGNQSSQLAGKITSEHLLPQVFLLFVKQVTRNNSFDRYQPNNFILELLSVKENNILRNSQVTTF